jgi:hypothetical protein
MENEAAEGRGAQGNPVGLVGEDGNLRRNGGGGGETLQRLLVKLLANVGNVELELGQDRAHGGARLGLAGIEDEFGHGHGLFDGIHRN